MLEAEFEEVLETKNIENSQILMFRNRSWRYLGLNMEVWAEALNSDVNPTISAMFGAVFEHDRS